ncbi:hypothetical protein [Jongsikchunia kroppenstedtii]|uniref:hypothetical protein n=1 Tax=Jongsikchunia kroppenstedtii TaxID=1121721 RepID=UPI0003634C71|nr:hypothetical protein [Jongsikchunia kroppenstedtii]
MDNSGGSRARQAVAWVLVVAFAAVSIVAVATGFVRYRLLDTDHYVAAMTSLADDPAIQDYVIAVATDTVVTQTNLHDRVAGTLQSASGAMPNAPQPATGAAADAATRRATAQAQSTIRQAVAAVVTSDQFISVWAAANRQAHPHVVDILTGRHSTVQAGDDGTVSVQLGPVVAAAKDRLAAGGFPYAQYIPQVNRTFVIAESPALRRTQSIVQPVMRAAPVLPWVALALAVLAIGGRRLRMLAGLGWSLAVAMGVLAVALWIGRQQYLRHVPDAVMPRPAASAVFDTIVDPVWMVLAVLAGAGLLVALTAQLIPRSGRLVDSVRRRAAAPAADDAGSTGSATNA